MVKTNPVTPHLKRNRILVLPGGGGTGIATAVMLAEIERRTQMPIWKQFDEIWGSSIGAFFAALLTTRRQDQSVMTAQDILDFTSQLFSNPLKAWGIREEFFKLIGTRKSLSDTLIPIKIIAAQVNEWKLNSWPTQTSNVALTRQTHPWTCLSKIIGASTRVFPLHRPQMILGELGERHYFVDPGCQVVSNPSLNPLKDLLESYLKQLNTIRDRVTFVFLSNGWVRIDEKSYEIACANQGHLTDWFNVDFQLDQVFKKWNRIPHVGLLNLAGMGMIPNSLIKAEAETFLIKAPFQNLIEILEQDIQTL